MLRILLRKKRFYALTILFGFLVFSYNFLELRMNDKSLEEELSQNAFNYQAEVNYLQFKDRKIRFVEVGSDELPLIVFIHGAPSSSSFWLSYMKDSVLLSNAKLLAVDRPGYGYSGFGSPETSIAKQAEYIAPIIRAKRTIHKKIIIHGSSYGGTLTARLAMDYPELMDGVVFQSASLAPGKETTYWITHPTSAWPLKWIIPTTFRIANEEKLSHKSELIKMEPLWDKISAYVTILHGKSDGLIFPENALFAQEHLKNALGLKLKLVEDAGHDLAWTQRDLIINSLLEILHESTHVVHESHSKSSNETI